ncbi:MAG: hypoxanthine phosphoribosyltransferase [Microbacteriaceae bacterium]|nr:hypoxanthine phosphoribosyltransferase [Microbacteriaceae bacterium]
MRYDDVSDELDEILVTEEHMLARLAELAREVELDYDGQDLLLVGVLKGAVMVMSDLSRALTRPVTMDWMAVSSYGHGTTSSGVVRILKDLDIDIAGKNVLLVEDIIDTGLTLSWLRDNLLSRGASSVKIFAALRKPDALKVDIVADYLGFDIPNKFVVGYGLDYAENYRHLRDVAVLSPRMYADSE